MHVKGWINIKVQLENGARYSIYFSDPIRLRQDTEQSVNNGEPCFTLPGLVVLQEVTVEAIESRSISVGARFFLSPTT